MQWSAVAAPSAARATEAPLYVAGGLVAQDGSGVGGDPSGSIAGVTWTTRCNDFLYDPDEFGVVLQSRNASAIELQVGASSATVTVTVDGGGTAFIPFDDIPTVGGTIFVPSTGAEVPYEFDCVFDEAGERGDAGLGVDVTVECDPAGLTFESWFENSTVTNLEIGDGRGVWASVTVSPDGSLTVEQVLSTDELRFPVSGVISNPERQSEQAYDLSVCPSAQASGQNQTLPATR